MIFAVIVPIFSLLALGYLSVKSQLLNKEQIHAIGAFVIKISLPALFFQALASKDFHEIWFAEYFYVYTAVTFFLFLCSFGLMRKYYAQSLGHSAILSLGAGMSNTGLIGVAVLSLLLGQKAMTYTSLVVIIESVLLIPLVLVLIALDTQQQTNIWGVIRNTFFTLLKNPLFMGVMLGIACAIFKVHIPVYIDQILKLIGQCASPLALFAIGGGIVGMTLKYLDRQCFYLVFSSNVVMPLLMYLGLSQLTSVSQEMVYVGTLIAALPMPSIFAMLGQTNGLTEKTLTSLLMSTMVGFSIVAVLITLWWG